MSCHQNCPLWARLYQHVSCKKPLLCSSLSGNECKHGACPSTVPLLLAAPVVIHEKNWKCLDVQATGLPVAQKEHFHQPNFLNCCSQSGKSCKRSRCTSSRHCYLCFRFLLVYASGFPVAPHSYFHFFLVLDFRCICQRQIRNPVMKMMMK